MDKEMQDRGKRQTNGRPRKRQNAKQPLSVISLTKRGKENKEMKGNFEIGGDGDDTDPALGDTSSSIRG